MEITDLRYFHAVAVTRSFARAAERVHISRSAVSKALRRLEDELQTPLLERTTREVTVTEAGRIVQRHCEGLFEGLETLRSEIEGLTDTATGTLTVGATEVFSIFALPSAVVELVARRPGIDVRCFTLTPEQMRVELLNGRLDVGLVVGDVAGKPFRHHALGTTETSLVCNPRSPLLAAPYERAITETSFVTLDCLATETHPLGRACAPPQGGRPGPTVDTLCAATQLILDGPFAGLLPELAVHCQLNHGELIRVPTPDSREPLTLGALTPKGPPRLAALTLLQCLQAIIAEAAIRACGRS